jgi:hypothetical protein
MKINLNQTNQILSGEERQWSIHGDHYSMKQIHDHFSDVEIVLLRQNCYDSIILFY